MGSVVSLMDQELYGQLVAFMINMIISSVLFYLDDRMILIPYSFSVLIMLVFLPFFQRTADVLIGHYVNLVIFIIISWLASRIVFRGYVHDFNNRVLLEKSNTMLAKEIESNKDINKRLAKAIFS
jgi:hypothetical protein